MITRNGGMGLLRVMVTIKVLERNAGTVSISINGESDNSTQLVATAAGSLTTAVLGVPEALGWRRGGILEECTLIS